MRVDWVLPGFLEMHGLKPRAVEAEALRLGYPLGRNTIYRLLEEDGPKNINRDTLAAVLGALSSLTGRQVTACDLLEMVSA